MTKRAHRAYAPRKHDAYDTIDPVAVLPLVERLAAQGDGLLRYCEPCAGYGALTQLLGVFGHECVSAWDLEPRAAWIGRADALSLTAAHLGAATCIVTNPPWSRGPLHRMIRHFVTLAPTWLLFDADWMYTGQSAQLLPYCREIVAVGRVSWMGNGQAGYDNAAWYHFTAEAAGGLRFYGPRQAWLEYSEAHYSAGPEPGRDWSG